LDSAHWKGPETLFHRVLIVVAGGITGEDGVGRIFNFEICNVLACGDRTNHPMDKRRSQLDSARQIVPETPWVAALITVGHGLVMGGWKRELEIP